MRLALPKIKFFGPQAFIVFHFIFKLQNFKKMNKNYVSDGNLKKLMKIIYEKQKQIDKYKRMAKNKDKSNESDCLEDEKNFVNARMAITQQLNENKEFLKAAVEKMNKMGTKISLLQNQLKEEEEKNNFYEHEIKNLTLQLQSRENEVKRMEKQRKKMQISRQQIVINVQESQSRFSQIQLYNISLKNQNIEILSVNKSLEAKVKKMKEIFRNVSKILQNKLNKFSKSQLKIKQVDQESELQELAIQLIEKLSKWQGQLKKKEDEWKQRFEKELSEKSIDGISNLINSFDKKKFQQEEEEIFQNSEFKRNEEQLLKNLELQCNKSEVIEKQKLIELSQVKQNLLATKEVLTQLNDQLGVKQNIITLCKQTFQSICSKNSVNEHDEDVSKIKTILGIKN